jgi:hypothetical protein
METPLVLTSPEKGIGSNPDNPDASTLREKIFGGRNKPSRKPKSESPPEDSAKLQRELEEIFAAENWEEISSLYFDARFMQTGFPDFQLSDKQKKTLGMSLGKCMKMLLKIDPGYIALMVFTANFGGLILQKEMIYKQAKAIRDKENAKKSA